MGLGAVFLFGDLGRHTPRGFSPSAAPISHGPDDGSQRERLSDGVSSSTPAADSQVWWSFLSFSSHSFLGFRDGNCL